MKKIISLLLSLLMLLTFAACAAKGNTEDKNSNPADEPIANLPNPFTEYATLEEAAAAVGFSFTAPASLLNSDAVLYRVSAQDQLLEIVYTLQGTEVARIRMALGTEDISGDYNEYANVTTLEVNGLTITCKGNGDTIATAFWTDGTYAYALSASEAMTAQDVQALVSAMNPADEPIAGLPNPFAEYETAAEAAAAVGFETELPETVAASNKVLYRVMDGVLLEVIYFENDAEVARIRKAPGAADISGVNTLFTAEEVQDVNGRQVTFKGDSEKIQLAIWTEGEYTYSVFAEKGLDMEVLTAAVAAIH